MMTPAREFNQRIKSSLKTENSSDIVCPFTKSGMTTCVARDGDMAIFLDNAGQYNRYVCFGCNKLVTEVLSTDISQFKSNKK